MLTIRISFEKRGEAAYISLLDLQRVFHRILKRSGLPVYYTQGFNPHIYLSFNCPLSLGQESLCESCEVKTADENADLTAWQATLQPYMPHGIRILRVAPAQRKSTEIVCAEYALTRPPRSGPEDLAAHAAGAAGRGRLPGHAAPALRLRRRGQHQPLAAARILQPLWH